MPRASDGSYSLPGGTVVATGDTLLTSQHNPPFLDVATALSNSLDRDGKGGMRANLAMNGNRITGLSPGVNLTDAVTVSQLSGGGDGISVPLGAVLDYWGTTAPSGFLFCAGQAISRTDYADLFAVIGTGAGPGNGSTTFNIPDYRAAVSAGKADMGGSTKALLSNFTATVMGALFGSQSHTLTEAEMPAHTHTVNDPGHAHTAAETGGPGATGGGVAGAASADTSTETTGITIGSTGGGGAHNNVQPTLICCKIIRVL